MFFVGSKVQFTRGILCHRRCTGIVCGSRSALRTLRSTHSILQPQLQWWWRQCPQSHVSHPGSGTQARVDGRLEYYGVRWTGKWHCLTYLDSPTHEQTSLERQLLSRQLFKWHLFHWLLSRISLSIPQPQKPAWDGKLCQWICGTSLGHLEIAIPIISARSPSKLQNISFTNSQFNIPSALSCLLVKYADATPWAHIRWCW